MYKTYGLLFVLLFYGYRITVLGQTSEDQRTTPGVSYALSVRRAARLRDIHYALFFHLPAAKDTPVQGEEKISFTLQKGGRAGGALLLDFKASSQALQWITVNGRPVTITPQDEHLAIPAKLLHRRSNTIETGFTAGNSALNRNSEFLYTLLVPDKARTLFPCFDQPDLKAVFELTLTAPAGWKVMGNAPLLDSTGLGDSCRYRFGPSDRIPTYLFSFVAGRWSSATRTVDGRPMRFLYRETDSTKLRLSLDPIFRIEGQALRFLQDYTTIAYPFQKLDLVAIPDFQFGGMEHVGAIQYKASSLFLDSGATREQLIGRSNLLSHETAHMWFGDLVTMTWFNDVWMKEVFANFMADKISSVTLPDGNYDLKFLTDHYPAAYSVDRTAGTHPIRQQLDNLQDAGSLYGNIIYHKAPIMMRQLERIIGPDAFRDGLRDYLHGHVYGNASWPDLIRALQGHTTVDLTAWNGVWVDGAGRPSFSYQVIDGSNGKIADLIITQRGEDSSNRFWPQVFGIALVYQDRVDTLTVNMNAPQIHVTAAQGRKYPRGVLLNSNGDGYGIFAVTGPMRQWLMGDEMSQLNAVSRAAMYINLYENMLAGNGYGSVLTMTLDLVKLTREPEELNLNILLDQLVSIYWHFLSPAQRNQLGPRVEEEIWKALLRTPTDNEKKLLFRTYSSIVLSREGQDRLYHVWKDQNPPAGVKLSEDDYTGLAAALALRVYPGYADILKEQGERIQNSDRRARWQFLQAALSADTAERDRFFASLKDPTARRKEAWVLTALSYLHYPLRTAYSEKYLPATLDWLADIQRTGDVFFPQSWLQTSFGFYRSASAAQLVTNFLQTHPGYDPKLKAKILQATDNLYRAQKIRE
jgi:aminopeptidase N